MDELISKRNWDSKTFDTGRVDEKESTIYGAKLQNGLHDIEPDGSFVECDPSMRDYIGNVSTLEAVRGRYGHLRAGDTGSESKDRIKILTKRNCGISLKLKGHRTYGPWDDTTRKIRFDTNDGITLNYYPSYKGVSIVITIDNPQTAFNKYTFSIKKYGCDYEYVDTEDGIHCVSSTGKDDVLIKATYVVDSEGNYGPISIKKGLVVDGYQEAVKTIDPVWLGNAVGPVFADPNITIEDGVSGGVIDDALMNNGVPAANYGVKVNMNCNDFTSRQNWAIRTNLTGWGIGTVTLAKYLLYCDDVFGGGNFACNLWPIKLAWNEGTKNGASEAGSICALSSQYLIQNWTTSNAQSAGNDYDDTLATASFTAPASIGAYEVTLDNSIIQARVDGGFDEGDVCHPVSLTSSKSFRTQTGEDTNQPQMYIEWVEAVAVGFNRINGFFGLGRLGLR